MYISTANYHRLKVVLVHDVIVGNHHRKEKPAQQQELIRNILSK